MTIQDQVAGARARLRRAGVATAAADAEWLLAGALGVGRAALGLRARDTLDAAAAAAYAASVARRAAREPLQRILGWEGFRGLRIGLSGAVLVPRPETEVLVEWALELLPQPGDRAPLVVDVGTGSGCIALGLLAERADILVVATDISPAALATARRTAGALGLSPRLRLLVADGLDAVGPSARRPHGPGIDLVVANLPYLPSASLATLEPEVRLHEPRGALDGGPDGLTVIRAVVAGARRALAPVGALALETAGPEQAARVAALCRAAGFEDVRSRTDLAGVVRFVAARAPDRQLGDLAGRQLGDLAGRQPGGLVGRARAS